MPFAAAVGAIGVIGGAYIASQGSQSAANTQANAINNQTAAANQSAQLSYQLGQQQLAQAQAQYNAMAPYQQQVMSADAAAQNAQNAQSQQYFNLWQQNAPQATAQLQQQTAQAAAQSQAGVQALASNPYLQTMTGSDAQVYAQNQGQINPMVDNAVADARGLTTQNMNQVMRMGMRYGMSPNAAMMNAGSLGIGAASNEVAAANGALQTGLSNVRNQASTGYNAAVQNYGLGTAANQQAINNSMGLLNSYRGLPANSSQATSVATNAGTNAINTGNSVNSVLNNATNQSNNTMMQGQQIQMNGLGNALRGATSLAGLQQSAGITNANNFSSALGLLSSYLPASSNTGTDGFTTAGGTTIPSDGYTF